MKLKTEKITKDDQLTVKEQNQMLEDLFMMEAIVVAFQNYVRSIGKEKESKRYIQKFVNELTNETFMNEMKKQEY